MRRVLALAVCGLAGLPVPARAQQAVSPLAQAETAFAVDLYGKLGQAPGNLFFSPYSIGTALDMVYVGARGTTADEMARVLHLELLDGADKRQALLAAGKADLQASGQADGFTLQSANALWGDKGFAFDPGFISDIQTSFGGDLKRVNFNHPAWAADKINRWVAAQTQDKIQNLITPDMLQGDPAMVLTNAVYFKANWADNFEPAETRQSKFHVSATQDVNAEMMNMQDDYSLTQADGVKVLSIPYSSYGMSMVIILPDDNQGLTSVEAGLSAVKLNKWLAEEQSVPVILALPKFQTDSSFNLNQMLTSLRMTTAFDKDTADFTGIADPVGRKLYVGAVVHKAHIGVDENGTEAAAATAVVMGVAASAMMSGPPPPRPVVFNADHPFIYLIYSGQTGEILFMGRVDDPTQ